MESKDVIIIIPAYNEENNIVPLIKKIRSKVSSADILVIDDGSADRTARVAEKAGVLVARLPFNLYYATKISSLHDRVKDLAQHVAILQSEVHRLNNK